MADAITTQIVSDTAGVKFVVKRTNISDGTGETDSVLVNPTTSNFMTTDGTKTCLLYTSPSPRDQRGSGMAA
mgnify:CR=1 FL=1